MSKTVEVLEALKSKLEEDGYVGGQGLQALTQAIEALKALEEAKGELGDILYNTVTPELVEDNFPKGTCSGRGAALVLHAEMLIWFRSQAVQVVGKIIKDFRTTINSMSETGKWQYDRIKYLDEEIARLKDEQTKFAQQVCEEANKYEAEIAKLKKENEELRKG